MAIAIITGSSGLIGSEAVEFFHNKGMDVIGIDNNMREYFFGREGSTSWRKEDLEKKLKRFTHQNVDIRDFESIEKIFIDHAKDIEVVIHTAAQPSHDWSHGEPLTDFGVNAQGTIHMIEATRRHCPHVPFIFTSTNKVYGDHTNRLPLIELEKRYEVDMDHPTARYGYDEYFPIDQCKHSLFGVHKVAADLIVQEYARHYKMKAASFRGSCLTGPAHSSVETHGFLAYLAKCFAIGRDYTIYGYKGKQVRDNIHSYDLVNCFWHFYQKPSNNSVYNIGGGRQNSISVLEAIDILEKVSGRKINIGYTEQNRIGDPIWLIGDNRRFETDYPKWKQTYNLEKMLSEMYFAYKARA